MSIYSLRYRAAKSICPPALLPSMTRKPRIAIDADVLRALRAWAARDGRDADTLATEVLRAALPAEVASFAKLGGAEAPREKAPLDIESPRKEKARKKNKARITTTVLPRPRGNRHPNPIPTADNAHSEPANRNSRHYSNRRPREPLPVPGMRPDRSEIHVFPKYSHIRTLWLRHNLRLLCSSAYPEARTTRHQTCPPGRCSRRSALMLYPHGRRPSLD